MKKKFFYFLYLYKLILKLKIIIKKIKSSRNYNK